MLKERHSYFKSLHPIGRLDADSSGLLIFSSDGEVTQYLLNPRKAIEREYECLVLGEVNHLTLQDRLAKGIQTSEGIFPASLSLSRTFSSKEVS
jgi:23S rRNA pseudouridine2605 synthase